MSVNKNQINNQLQSRGQFSQIPNEIHHVKNLSPYARLIWIYLASEGPGWEGSNAKIAANQALSISTVKRAIKHLTKFNMLITTGHDLGTDYELVSSDKWKVEWTDFYLKQLEAQSSKTEGLVPRKPGGQSRGNQAPSSSRTGIQEDLILSNTTNTSVGKKRKDSLYCKDKDWKKIVDGLDGLGDL